jgi:hypothetical protein
MNKTPFKITMNRRLFTKKLRELFPQFDELQTYRDPETNKLQGYQGIPTNYGSVCFHALFDEEHLESYYPPYLTEDEQQEIDEIQKANPVDSHVKVLNYLKLKGLIHNGGPIPINHPEFITRYYVQVSLSMIDLSIHCSGNIEEDIKHVEWQLARLTLLQALRDTYHERGFIDYEVTWEFMEFDDANTTEADGYSLSLTLDVPSDMTLKDTEIKIDTAIGFVKAYINQLPRSDELFLY